MKEKVLSLVAKVITNLTIKHVSVKKAPLICVYAFLLLLLSCIFAFLAGWTWMWAVHGEVRFSELNAFVGTISSVPFIAAVTFYCSYLVDSNKDGVPDKLEDTKDDTKSD